MKRVVILGDLNGPVRHLGACAACRAQFLSPNDRVVVTDRGVVCVRCANKETT